MIKKLMFFLCALTVIQSTNSFVPVVWGTFVGASISIIPALSHYFVDKKKFEQEKPKDKKEPQLIKYLLAYGVGVTAFGALLGGGIGVTINRFSSTRNNLESIPLLENSQDWAWLRELITKSDQEADKLEKHMDANTPPFTRPSTPFSETLSETPPFTPTLLRRSELRETPPSQPKGVEHAITPPSSLESSPEKRKSRLIPFNSGFAAESHESFFNETISTEDSNSSQSGSSESSDESSECAD